MLNKGFVLQTGSWPPFPHPPPTPQMLSAQILMACFTSAPAGTLICAASGMHSCLFVIGQSEIEPQSFLTSCKAFLQVWEKINKLNRQHSVLFYLSSFFLLWPLSLTFFFFSLLTSIVGYSLLKTWAGNLSLGRQNTDCMLALRVVVSCNSQSFWNILYW